jgi:hypothetical protein
MDGPLLRDDRPRGLAPVRERTAGGWAPRRRAPSAVPRRQRSPAGLLVQDARRPDRDGDLAAQPPWKHRQRVPGRLGRCPLLRSVDTGGQRARSPVRARGDRVRAGDHLHDGGRRRRTGRAGQVARRRSRDTGVPVRREGRPAPRRRSADLRLDGAGRYDRAALARGEDDLGRRRAHVRPRRAARQQGRQAAGSLPRVAERGDPDCIRLRRGRHGDGGSHRHARARRRRRALLSAGDGAFDRSRERRVAHRRRDDVSAQRRRWVRGGLGPRAPQLAVRCRPVPAAPSGRAAFRGRIPAVPGAARAVRRPSDREARDHPLLRGPHLERVERLYPGGAPERRAALQGARVRGLGGGPADHGPSGHRRPWRSHLLRGVQR